MDPNQQNLLTAIIGATAGLWAIGMAVYAFVYQYFQEKHLPEAKEMAKGATTPSNRMMDVLTRNLGVVVGFTIAGILAVFTIGLAAGALARQDEVLALQASQWFALTIAAFFALFTFELMTTIFQLVLLMYGVKKQQG